MECEGWKGQVGGLRTGNSHRTDSKRQIRKGGREENRVGRHEGRKKRPAQRQERAGPVACGWVTWIWSVLVSRALPGKGGEMEFSNCKVGRSL